MEPTTRSGKNFGRVLRELAVLAARRWGLRRGTERSGVGESGHSTRSRVVVHFARDRLGLVQSAMGYAHVQGGMVYGEIAEERISELEQAGLVVDRLDLSRARLTWPAPTPLVERRTATAGSGAGPPAREDDIYVLSLAGPLLRSWREQLEEVDAQLIEHRGEMRFTARIRLDALPTVAALDFVDSARQFTPQETIDAWQLLEREAAPTDYDARLELLVHEARGVESVVSWLDERDVQLELVAGHKVRFSDPGRALIVELASHPEVASIYEFVDPVPFNDHARALVGRAAGAGSGAADAALNGAGQIVGVADSGIDMSHPDLRSRIELAIPRARPEGTFDRTGHGTHVTGSIVGTGYASDGQIQGIAPEAHVIFQSIMDDRDKFVVDPSMVDVLKQAYEHGARVHCNSWGVEGNVSAYRALSREVDEFVAAHPDMLVVVAAGNDGTAANPRNSKPGWVDLMSIASPATAKNALTVGASRSDRQPVGEPPLTWGRWWPKKYPEAPIREELLSGDAQQMAALSGRGPCDEQLRIKPDVVAPGTFILSTRAPAISGSFWAEHSPTYAYEGGTSMAAAIVAGCALLVRQHLVEDRGHLPSAALLKAILINGTRWLTGADAVADHAFSPNYHQGFGCVWLPDSIPPLSGGVLGMEFSDTWADASMEIAESGNGWEFALEAVDGAPLRLCLAWTDPPGRSVQNNLVMQVNHRPTGGAWLGNQYRPRHLDASIDKANNVQAVRIDQPHPGKYSVWVEADNLTQGAQRFALVATGAAGLRVTPISPY